MALNSLLTLPEGLFSGEATIAVGYLTKYFDSSNAWPYYSGALFDRLDGGGAR